MSKPSRHSNPGAILSRERTFFVTSNIVGGKSLFQSPAPSTLFIKTLYEYRAQKKFRLHAFVVMPDHFHVLLTVGREMTVERAVQLIKGGFAFRAGKELGFPSPFWQRGFSEVRVLDRAAYYSHVGYIHQNPVRNGLVIEAPDFPYSSAWPGFDLDPEPQGLKPGS
jgi:putative transposase